MGTIVVDKEIGSEACGFTCAQGLRWAVGSSNESSLGCNSITGCGAMNWIDMQFDVIPSIAIHALQQSSYDTVFSLIDHKRDIISCLNAVSRVGGHWTMEACGFSPHIDVTRVLSWAKQDIRWTIPGTQETNTFTGFTNRVGVDLFFWCLAIKKMEGCASVLLAHRAFFQKCSLWGGNSCVGRKASVVSHLWGSGGMPPQKMLGVLRSFQWLLIRPILYKSQK